MCIDVHSMSFKINETIQRDTKSKYRWLFIVQLRGLFSSFRPCTKSWSSCDCSATRTDSSTLPRMSQRYQTHQISSDIKIIIRLSQTFTGQNFHGASKFRKFDFQGSNSAFFYLYLAPWLPRLRYDGMQHQANTTKALAWAAKPFAICLGAVEDQITQNWWGFYMFLLCQGQVVQEAQMVK